MWGSAEGGFGFFAEKSVGDRKGHPYAVMVDPYSSRNSFHMRIWL